MLQKRPFVFRGFESTQGALGSLDACEAAGVRARLVQLPAACGGKAACGTALRTYPADDEAVGRVLQAAGIAVACRMELEDFE